MPSSFLARGLAACRRARRHLGLPVLGACLLAPVGLAAADGQTAAPATRALIAVPYLTQTEQLCGGAALAMVFRYWGATNVFAQDFAPLLDPGGKGIRASQLASAVSGRGWTAAAGRGTAETLSRATSRGQPSIAMIEDRPGTFHYVVVVGLSEAVVVYHDPARAPHVLMPWSEFDRRWRAADRWMLVALPPERDAAEDRVPAGPGLAPSPGPAAPPVVPGSAATTASTRCTAQVRRAVTQAGAGQVDAAERDLIAATSACPDDVAAWTELAGVRFVQKRYDEAAALAAEAVRLDASDTHARQLLATSRFLARDLPGALAAWNALGTPRTDVVSVDGATRTRHPVIVDLLALAPRTLLTPQGLARAARRLAELPTAASTQVTFQPDGQGRAAVTAAVAERSVLPKGLFGWGGVGVRSVFQREVEVDVVGVSGSGEVWSPAYRFSPRRPRLRLGVDVPAPGRLPGLLSLEGYWERQTYAYDALGPAPVEETRRRVSVALSEWLTSTVRIAGATALDHIDGQRYLAADGLLTTRWWSDRLSLALAGAAWAGLGGAAPFRNGEAVVTWRSTSVPDRPVVKALLGTSAASRAAPLAAWPGASSGKGRGALLRAHGLLDDNVVTGAMFGRRLAFATVEYDRPVWRGTFGGASVAGFVDSARAWQRLAPGASPWHVDAGVGARFATPGGNGIVRLDVAVGLRDGATKVSAGYVLPWGRR